MPQVGEVIAIASEVLAGFVINSNATWVSKQLVAMGVRVDHHQTVGDIPMHITEALDLAASRSDIVLITGGLGPTADDRTRMVVAEYFGRPIQLNKEILDFLRKSFGSKSISLEDQATIPVADHYFLNSVGTAPGLFFKKNGTLFFFLPGVPVEMKEMLETSLLPFLKQLIPSSQLPFMEKVYLFQVPESEVDPLVRRFQKQFPTLDVGSYPSQGTLTLVFSSEENREAVFSSAQIVRETFPKRHFDAPGGAIEEAIHLLFKKRGWTLSLAESCTGGALSSLLTIHPGVSDFFLGSIVSYSDQLKRDLLGVEEKVLLDHGAVSEQVVKQMADGVRRVTGSTHSIAISGIAGPSGGSKEKPVGTVWLACSIQGTPTLARKVQINSSREGVIHRAMRLSLVDLWRAVHV